MIARRGTILIPSGPFENADQKHLFIVCNDPDARGDVFLAGLSSWKNNLCDGTCILDPGCHPFVRVKSYILYRSCRIEKLEDLENGVRRGLFVPRDPIEEETFLRVLEGILASPHTKRRLKNDYRRLAAL